MEGGERQQQPRLLAAREVGALGVGLVGREAVRAEPRAPLRLGRLRHQLEHVIVGRRLRVELVELVLREVADVDALGAVEPARERRELAGDELGERRLAVAVLAEQRDAVVLVDAQIETLQHRPVRRVSDRDILEAHQRTGQCLRRLRQMERRRRASSICAAIGCILASALTRLCACAALVALALKRSMNTWMRRRSSSCFFLQLELEPLLLAPRLLEVVVAAGVERELAAVEMQDRGDGAVQQVAVVADDQHRVRIGCADSFRATARLRDRGSWSARRAAAPPARGTARRRARRACASRPTGRRRGAAAPPR